VSGDRLAALEGEKFAGIIPNGLPCLRVSLIACHANICLALFARKLVAIKKET